MNSPRTLNPICAVFFGGFKSDTYTLQKAGWQLSMEQDWMSGVRLAMKHEQYGLYAITGAVDLRVFEQAMHTTRVHCPVPFQVQWMGSNARFHVIPQMGHSMFQPIDAKPAFRNYEEMSFEDMIPFRPISTDAPEIVIAQQSVPELMNLILKMQDPKQAEIRDRARKQAWREVQDRSYIDPTGYNPVADIKAQIVCVAG